MAELIGSITILIGAVFLFSAGLGMLRMPDAFTRIQAGTKASTLGNTLVLVRSPSTIQTGAWSC